MTRDEYSRTLRYMERLRMDSYEAETAREERRMTAEYGRLAKQIEPYALGTKEFDLPAEKR
jgi:hypothetical protein